MRIVRIIDISPPVSERIAVWPGDVPYRYAKNLDAEAGDHLTLGSIHTTLHLGAHADAPSHYGASEPGFGERDLEDYFGDCQVMHVGELDEERVYPRDLPGPIVAPRLLIATGTFPDPETWNPDFASLSPELVEYAHAQGVILLGIDTPSVDPMRDRSLHAHRAVLRHDLAILEGLVLSHVPDGTYTLSAFPLRLQGVDASPVRAVLVDGL